MPIRKFCPIYACIQCYVVQLLSMSLNNPQKIKDTVFMLQSSLSDHRILIQNLVWTKYLWHIYMIAPMTFWEICHSAIFFVHDNSYIYLMNTKHISKQRSWNVLKTQGYQGGFLMIFKVQKVTSFMLISRCAQQ